MKKENKVIVFGELLQKFSPSINGQRMSQADVLVREPAGAEFNVAAALSRVGNIPTSMITKIPDNMDGDWIEEKILKKGIDTQYVIRDFTSSACLGSYEFEEGIYPRQPKVCYDRSNSSFAQASSLDYSVKFGNFKLFHTSGISLAIQPKITTELIKQAHKVGCLVSFDVNYRANLWTTEEACELIESILPYIDILFISKETLERTFNCTDLKSTMASWAENYNIKIIASTQRTPVKTGQQFTSLVYDRTTYQYFSEDPYELTDLRGRVGSGDAYVSGFLLNLLKYDFNVKSAMKMGNAATALKCSCIGDILVASEEELENVIAKHQSTSTTQYEELKR